MSGIVFKAIGVVRTPFKERKKLPRQAALARHVEAVVELDPEYVDGLSDLEGFSHIILLTHLHRSEGFSLRVTPPVDTELRGLFATRSPRRPNSIGFSVVRLENIEGNRLHIWGADMVDGTPLLDIKPYIPRTDSWSEASLGWLEGIVDGPGDE